MATFMEVKVVSVLAPVMVSVPSPEIPSPTVSAAPVSVELAPDKFTVAVLAAPVPIDQFAQLT